MMLQTAQLASGSEELFRSSEVVRSQAPGGNVTGFANDEPSLAGKWVELLKEIKPDVRRATILFNPETTPDHASPFVQEFEATPPQRHSGDAARAPEAAYETPE